MLAILPALSSTQANSRQPLCHRSQAAGAPAVRPSEAVKAATAVQAAMRGKSDRELAQQKRSVMSSPAHVPSAASSGGRRPSLDAKLQGA